MDGVAHIVRFFPFILTELFFSSLLCLSPTNCRRQAAARGTRSCWRGKKGRTPTNIPKGAKGPFNECSCSPYGGVGSCFDKAKVLLGECVLCLCLVFFGRWQRCREERCDKRHTITKGTPVTLSGRGCCALSKGWWKTGVRRVLWRQRQKAKRSSEDMTVGTKTTPRRYPVRFTETAATSRRAL